MGLIGMRERAALVGGTFAVESTPGNGSTVVVRIPAHNLGCGKTHNA
jgi:signal transduction histidine kinase